MKRPLRIALLVVALWVPAINSLGLSDDQRRQVRAGEIVVLDILPPGGDARVAQGANAPPHFDRSAVPALVSRRTPA